MESKNRNYGLSIVRLLAMVMIVVCHILQSQSNNLCFYFNVGVYLFLFLSGFLYGGKKISDIITFFKKQGLKLYVPYLLTLIVIIIADISTGSTFSIKDMLSSVLCLQWYKFTIPNCGHLWYVSCIIFCYALIPLLQFMGEALNTASKAYKWLAIVAVVVLMQLLYSFGAMPQEASKISCFVVAYFVACWRLYDVKFVRGGVLLPALFVCILIYFGIYVLEDIYAFTAPTIIMSYYKMFLGAMFVLSFNCLNVAPKKCCCKLLGWSDKYSYGIYLFHHIFILGSLSVMSLTSLKSVNIVVAICFAIIAGCCVTQLSSIVSRLFNKSRIRG